MQLKIPLTSAQYLGQDLSLDNSEKYCICSCNKYICSISKCSRFPCSLLEVKLPPGLSVCRSVRSFMLLSEHLFGLSNLQQGLFLRGFLKH